MRTTVSDLLDQLIIFGGEVMSRGEVYRSMIEEGHTKEAADYFAFHPKKYQEDQNDRT